MEITKIASIELDKTRMFKWEILLKDDTGYILERMPVKETEADATFKVAVENWLSACAEVGKPRTGISEEELKERRK